MDRGASRHTIVELPPRASGCSRSSPRTGTASVPACSRSAISMSTPSSPSSTISRPNEDNGVSIPATPDWLQLRSFLAVFLEFRYPDHLELAARVHAIPQKKGDVPALEYVDRDEVDALLNGPGYRHEIRNPGPGNVVPCLQCRAPGLRTGRPRPRRCQDAAARRGPGHGQGDGGPVSCHYGGKQDARLVSGCPSVPKFPTATCS